VERLQDKVSKLTGQMDEVRQKVDEVTQRFAEYQAKIDVKLEGLSSEKNAPVPENKEELFNQASAKLAAGDHQEARRLLRHFISRFPDDPRLDKAQLLLGDSYFAEQKFAQAIVEYKKVFEQFKQSSAVPDALGKTGMAFYQLKFCSDAQPFFSQVVKLYPHHPQAATAKKVLKLISQYKKNRNVCRP
jgi:tol-pal system protein YbgF